MSITIQDFRISHFENSPEINAREMVVNGLRFDDATQEKLSKCPVLNSFVLRIKASPGVERTAQVVSQNTFMSQHDIHTQAILMF